MYSSFLQSKTNNKNLDIKTNTIVTKVLFNQKKAVGVECVSNSKSSQYFANDIILSAGAYVTPKILMQSGIGEVEQLKQFNIPIIENLKGVGKNLQDHHEVPVISRVNPGYSYFER